MSEISIAIADDNLQTLSLLNDILEGEEDFHVVGKADNGEDAYNMIVKTSPDVVLLDVIMPRMDGITVMERVRSNAAVTKMPSFIMVTAAGSENITEDAFRMGANYYIMKPFNKDIVVDKVRRVGHRKSKTTGLSGMKKVKPYVNKNEYMEQNLENDVTQMLHEMGIPAHIKGYQYLRDCHCYLCAGPGNADQCYQDSLSVYCQKASDDSEPCGACDPPCHRGCVEQRQDGYDQ